jgi:hypothetical protein
VLAGEFLPFSNRNQPELHLSLRGAQLWHQRVYDGACLGTSGLLAPTANQLLEHRHEGSTATSPNLFSFPYLLFCHILQQLGLFLKSISVPLWGQ